MKIEMLKDLGCDPLSTRACDLRIFIYMATYPLRLLKSFQAYKHRYISRYYRLKKYFYLPALE